MARTAHTRDHYPRAMEDGDMENPLGIHCTICTEDAPCDACARQIAAEAAPTVHYHWGQNIPGYLPMADEPNTAASFEEARAGLVADIDLCISSYDMADDDDEQALGMVQSLEDACIDVQQYPGAPREGFTIYAASDAPHDLGIAFWIIACNEPECEVDR